MKNVSISTSYKNGIDHFNKLNLIDQMADNIIRLANNSSKNEYLEGTTYLHFGPFTFKCDADDVSQIFIVESED